MTRFAPNQRSLLFLPFNLTLLFHFFRFRSITTSVFVLMTDVRALSKSRILLICLLLKGKIISLACKNLDAPDPAATSITSTPWVSSIPVAERSPRCSKVFYLSSNKIYYFIIAQFVKGSKCGNRHFLTNTFNFGQTTPKLSTAKFWKPAEKATLCQTKVTLLRIDKIQPSTPIDL